MECRDSDRAVGKPDQPSTAPRPGNACVVRQTCLPYAYMFFCTLSHSPLRGLKNGPRTSGGRNFFRENDPPERAYPFFNTLRPPIL